jgi:hypothetical protein
LSLVLIDGTPSNIEFVSNVSKIYVYGQNFTGYHWDYTYSPIPPAKLDIYLFHEYDINNYNQYKNTTIGIYMALVSIFGFIQTLTTRRGVSFDEE